MSPFHPWSEPLWPGRRGRVSPGADGGERSPAWPADSSLETSYLSNFPWATVVRWVYSDSLRRKVKSDGLSPVPSFPASTSIPCRRDSSHSTGEAMRSHLHPDEALGRWSAQNHGSP